MRNEIYRIRVGDQTFAIETTLLQDIFIDALESGSNYWLGVDTNAQTVKTELNAGEAEDDLCLAERLFQYMEASDDDHLIYLFDIEDEDNAVEPICMNDWLKGVGMYLVSNNWTESDLENYDAETSDAIMQYAALGNLVYG